VHERAHAERHAADEHVDANVPAGGERVAESPRDPEREHVAGQLHRRPRADAEELPGQDVERHEQRARDEEPARDVVHDAPDALDHLAQATEDRQHPIAHQALDACGTPPRR
jgi:hypothetical protein